MKVHQLLEARREEFSGSQFFPDAFDKSWMKRYKSRIILSYRPPSPLGGLDQNAVAQAYEKALTKFKELRDAHPTKLMFKDHSADDYIKKMEYPGWTMVTQWVREIPVYGSPQNRFDWEWGKERKEPIQLEKQAYKPSMSMDEVTFTDLNNGRIEVKTVEKNGPKFRIWLTALQKMPKKLKGKNSTGRDLTDYFDIERARPQKMTFQGTLEEVKSALAKGFATGLKYDKQDHDKRQGALEKRKADSRFNAEMQKQRKVELYAKYGKEIVDRVKIKAMSLEGDDGYQWALFLDGQRHKSGMTHYQAEGEQRMMWNWLLKWEKMTPQERLEHQNAVRGVEAYFAYQAMEKSLEYELPKYLDAIKKNVKKYVDAKQMAKDGIENAKVSDAQAKKIFNDLMNKLRDRE